MTNDIYRFAGIVLQRCSNSLLNLIALSVLKIETRSIRMVLGVRSLVVLDNAGVDIPETPNKDVQKTIRIRVTDWISADVCV